MQLPHRDAADRPEASVTPDMAATLDTVQDSLTEAIAASVRRAVIQELPRTRDQFIHAVGTHVAGALSAKGPGTFGEMMRGLILIHAAQERAEAVLHTIALILDRDNPALTADCIAYAANMHGLQGGMSETQLARKHGVVRATVSKRVRECVEALELYPSRGMKDAEAPEVYKERAHQVHGTEYIAEDPKRKTKSIVASVDFIVRWAASMGENLQHLAETERAQLKALFARLTPICQTVALL